MKCKYCKKRIWFWQTTVFREIVGTLEHPKYVKTVHWKCCLVAARNAGGKLKREETES